MLDMYARPYIKGLTTNPTLMRKAGIANYRAFAGMCCRRSATSRCASRCSPTISREMERQALEIAVLGRQRLREDSGHQHPPRERAARCSGAWRPAGQAQRDRGHDPGAGAGDRRRAQSRHRELRLGVCRAASPTPASIRCRSWRRPSRCSRSMRNAELIWASSRELLNIFQADAVGCHVITVTNDILRSCR